LDLDIYFWHSTTGVEVDLVLYGKNKLIAIEVKASKKIDRKDFKGLLEFKKDYPVAQLFYLYAGDREEVHGDITAMSIVKFLENFKTL